MTTMLEVDEHHWWYRGRRQVIEHELERLPLAPDASALDAGCGSGRAMDELACHCAHVAGLELNAEAAELARGRGDFDVRVGRIERPPWEPESFDLIICLDVIEHTPDDVVALRELLRVSRPGARLIVTVPAYQALWSHHDQLNHHYRRYSRRRLARSVAESGWRLERITSFNSLLLLPAALVRLSRRSRGAHTSEATELALPPRWLNAALELPLWLESRWLAGGRTLPVGLSLLAIAVNPVSNARAVSAPRSPASA